MLFVTQTLIHSTQTLRQIRRGKYEHSLYYQPKKAILFSGIRLGRRTVTVPTTVSSLILSLSPVMTMPSMPPPPVTIPPVLTPVLIFLRVCVSGGSCTSVVIRCKSELTQVEDENES